MDPLLYDLLSAFVPCSAMPWTCGQCETLNSPNVNACRRCEPEAHAAELEALCAARS